MANCGGAPADREAIGVDHFHIEAVAEQQLEGGRLEVVPWRQLAATDHQDLHAAVGGFRIHR